MKEKEFKFCFEGEIAMKETVNISVSVNPASAPLTIVDVNGNPVADGGSITATPETVGVADTQVLFTVKGGTQPYAFSVSSGSVPAGVSLSSVINADGSETVTMSGTPTTAGAASFAITVADSSGASARVGVSRIA